MNPSFNNHLVEFTHWIWHKTSVPVFLERFVLPVFAAVVVLLAATNPVGFDTTQRLTGAATLIFAAYFVAHTVYKTPKSPPSESAPPIQPAPSPVNDQKEKPQSPKAAKAKKQLGPLTDGQRFMLQKKLVVYAGRSVNLVRVGNEPATGIVFEQLTTIFSESNWNVQSSIIGTVSVVGANFPNNPYLTSQNVASEPAKAVFSIFAAVGINLPLVPDAFSGPSLGNAPTPDIVIVIH